MPHSALFFFLFAPVIFQIPSYSSQLLQTREREKNKTADEHLLSMPGSSPSVVYNAKAVQKTVSGRGREERGREVAGTLMDATELGVLLCRVQLIVLDKN